MKILYYFFLTSVFFIFSAVAFAAVPEKATSFILETGKKDDMLVFIGRGGEIDGVINPTLEVSPGKEIIVFVKNKARGLIVHAFVVSDLEISSSPVGRGEETFVKFSPPKGEWVYHCPIPGHREAGMEGLIKVN